MYLTYEEYRSYGGNLSETAFSVAEFKARKRIDFLTDSRIRSMANIPEAVKLCMTAIIKAEGKTGVEAQINTPLIASFSTDGYSESYGSITEQASALQKGIDRMIREMLYGELDDKGIPLLYRGLDV